LEIAPRRAGMKTLATIFVCFGSLLFCNGCATSALWEEGRFARFHEPTLSPKLELFQSANDSRVLVVYEEGNEDTEARRQRAYWINPLTPAATNPFRPTFVALNQAKGLPRIPITINPAPAGYSAIATHEARAFFLFKDQLQVGFYELPVYADYSGRAKQIALTPLAVAADATIVGGAAAVLFAYWHAGGTGFPDIWPPSETK